MNKILLAVPVFLMCSYLQTAEAAGDHRSHKASKHRLATSPKHRHPSNNHHGTVSWYGPQFHGKRTASGERYDMYAMTAAHSSLPLLSYAKVTNLKNHRSVVVRINDRGAFHGKRAMDLSFAAAKQLGITGVGTVEITPLTSNEVLLPFNNKNKNNKPG